MWLKRSSVVVVFIALLVIAWAVDAQKRVSFSFDSLLPKGDSKEILSTYQKINRYQDIILASSSNMDEIIEQMVSLKGYQAVYPPSKQMDEFYKKYRFYIYDRPDSLPNSSEVYAKLLQLKDELTEGFRFYVDKSDPLSLFKARQDRIDIPQVKGFDNTFIFRLNIEPNEYELYYDKLHEIANGSYLFSPFFYQVENGRIFKTQAQFILGFSALILGLLYIYWLRKPLLFFLSYITLVSSAVFSQLVVIAIWNEVSFLSLVFSAAVSTISIDYMFHHYLHDMYGDKKGFSKSVFYGFITTFAAFLTLSLTAFSIIAQIALSASCALLFAYISFAFIYPHLNIGNSKTRGMRLKNRNLLSPTMLCLISFLIICTSYLWINFSVDIKSLDVENKNLRQKQDMLSLNMDNKTAILVSADNAEELISRVKTLQNGFFQINTLISKKEYNEKSSDLRVLDFTRLRKDIQYYAKRLGFKEGYFESAYSDELLNPPPPIYTDEFLSDSSLRVAKISNKIYTVGFYDKSNLSFLDSSDVIPIDSALLFQKELKGAAKELVLAGIFITLLIVAIIAFAAKRSFLSAFSFVITPLAVCSLIFIFIPMSILHIFMLVVVVAMSVDYGIYNVCLPGNRTNEAVFYSLLSTIAGFGVLALSSISSLRAIGVTALCATLTIWFLIYFIKTKNETYSAK